MSRAPRGTRPIPRSRKKRPRKRKRGPNPLYIVGGITGGLVVVILVVVVIVNTGNNDAKSSELADDSEENQAEDSDQGGSLLSSLTGNQEKITTNGAEATGKNVEYPLFQEYRKHVMVKESDENWEPEPERLSQLGPEQKAGEYLIRLPDRTKAAHHAAHLGVDPQHRAALEEAFSWGWPSSIQGKPNAVSFFYSRWENPQGPTARELQQIEYGLAQPRPGVTNQKIERGRCRGLPAWKVTREVQLSPEITTYSIIVHIVDGEHNLGIEGFALTPPGTPDYERMKAVVFSIQRSAN